MIGSLPEGFTLPNRILAIACPPLMPGNQASSTALTLPSQGMICAPPFSITTMVCGLATATAATSASWSMGVAWMTSVKFRLGMSIPSLVHWLTKTIATLEEAASEAAVVALVPSLYATAALGAAARIACSGEDGSQITCDQPGSAG